MADRLAGGVPEVMLHLRRAGLLETKALTVSGATLDEQLDEWEQSERRRALRKVAESHSLHAAAYVPPPRHQTFCSHYAGEDTTRPVYFSQWPLSPNLKTSIAGATPVAGAAGCAAC